MTRALQCIGVVALCVTLGVLGALAGNVMAVDAAGADHEP